MYVCVCKGLNDADINDAIQSGAKRVSEVFRHHGCKAQCGACNQTIKDALGYNNTPNPTQLPHRPLALTITST